MQRVREWMKEGLILAIAISLTVWIFFAALMVFTLPAYGQSNCGPYEQMVIRLESVFFERVTWTGFRGSDFFELWVDADGVSWSIVRRWPEVENACIMAAGEHWEFPEGEAPPMHDPGVEH